MAKIQEQMIDGRRVCRVEGCINPRYKQSAVCLPHINEDARARYKLKKAIAAAAAGKPLLADGRKPCSVEGCNNPRKKGHAMCPDHFNERRRAQGKASRKAAAAKNDGGAALQEQIVEGQRKRYRQNPSVAFTGQGELPPRVFKGQEQEEEQKQDEWAA